MIRTRRNTTSGDTEIHENRWRRINRYGVGIIALFSFFCIIAADPVQGTFLSVNDSVSLFYPAQENDCTFNVCSYWGQQLCCFHCYRINASLVTKIIYSYYMENKCTSGIKLTLEEVNFEDGIMNNSWWDIKAYVAHFFLKTCSLLDIEDGAFNSKYFSGAKSITFSKSQIPYYRKNMFTGMKLLLDFVMLDNDVAKHPNQFEDPDSEGIKFEYGVLDNFKNSLTTLQVQNSIINPEAIRNLTGIELNALQIIDFRYNKKMSYIPDGAFKTKSLLSLYISHNGLREIHDNAFINAPRVAKIYLQNNKLKTINEEIFTSFTVHNEISISNNDWVCSCNLKFLTMYKINDIDVTTCNKTIPLEEFLNNCTYC